MMVFAEGPGPPGCRPVILRASSTGRVRLAGTKGGAASLTAQTSKPSRAPPTVASALAALSHPVVAYATDETGGCHDRRDMDDVRVERPAPARAQSVVAPTRSPVESLSAEPLESPDVPSRTEF